MLKLLVEVVYSVCGLWGSHRTVECVRASVGLDDVWFRRPFCGSCGDNPEWKGHHFRWLSWVGVQFFVCGGVGHMFLNFTDIKGGLHEAYSTTYGLMTRSELEPRFLRVDLCSEVRLGLVTCWGRLGRWFWVCSRNSVRLAESWFRRD